MTVINTSELARKLGLTRVTVSRAINNDPRVASKTREKVVSAMREYCMEPSAIARALVRGRTRTIGMMIGTDLGGDYFNELLVGLAPELEAREFTLLMGVARFGPERERMELSAMLARRVEGILSQPLADNRDLYARLIRRDIPVVFVADYLDLPEAGWVVSDSPADTRLALTHLLDLGHCRIAYVGPDSPSAQMRSRPKMYRKVMREAGLAVPETFVFEGLEGGKEDIYQAVHAMMKQPEPPTAFLAAVDIIGFYILDQLRRDGWRVPQDVSVIGMGDMALGRYEMVALTTIGEDRTRMGRTAAQMLLDRIENKKSDPKQLFLPGNLIVRRTTGKPK